MVTSVCINFCKAAPGNRWLDAAAIWLRGEEAEEDDWHGVNIWNVHHVQAQGADKAAL
jgi:hypothetical protein